MCANERRPKARSFGLPHLQRNFELSAVFFFFFLRSFSLSAFSLYFGGLLKHFQLRASRASSSFFLDRTTHHRHRSYKNLGKRERTRQEEEHGGLDFGSGCQGEHISRVYEQPPLLQKASRGFVVSQLLYLEFVVVVVPPSNLQWTERNMSSSL